MKNTTISGRKAQTDRRKTLSREKLETITGLLVQKGIRPLEETGQMLHANWDDQAGILFKARLISRLHELTEAEKHLRAALELMESSSSQASVSTR